MNTVAVPMKVVHEAIDERQYVRTRIAAQVILHGKSEDGQVNVECELQDISLGGIGFVCNVPLKIGSIFDASIKMVLNKVGLNIDLGVKVVSQREGVVGAQFIEPDQQKRDILRYIISSYMSGEIADINGLFNVMQRENYIKERKQKSAQARTKQDRFKALAGSLAFTALGVAALCFVFYKTYMLFLRVPATQASVSANAYVLNMPENGFVKYLIKPGQKLVKQGEPIASISTQLATRFTTPSDIAALANLAPNDVQALLGRTTVETVINSPCDCEVYLPATHLDGYANKDTPLANLVPKNEELFVRAAVPATKLPDLNRVRSVRLSVFGADDSFSGKIINSSVDEKSQDVILSIRPDRPLARELYQKPAAVGFYLGLPIGSSF